VLSSLALAHWTSLFFSFKPNVSATASVICFPCTCAKLWWDGGLHVRGSCVEVSVFTRYYSSRVENGLPSHRALMAMRS
jgi:hypothetical protein